VAFSRKLGTLVVNPEEAEELTPKRCEQIVAVVAVYIGAYLGLVFGERCFGSSCVQSNTVWSRVGVY
jgi:hypothetical protein